jgi:uncharacterized membrane protein YedE/YeeE
MNKLTAFIAGLLFGLGLLLAGMANPSKVLAFLDLAGAWDPSLALVMIGAIGVAIGPLTWARHQSRSLLGKPMQLPTKRELDPRLIGGSLLFGIGWGIAGICPGPAVANSADRTLASNRVHVGHAGRHVVVYCAGDPAQPLIGRSS